MYFLLSCINMLVLHCNPQLATKLCRLLDACPLLMSPQDWFLGVVTSMWPHIYMEKSVAESIGTSQILKSFPNQKPHQNQLGQRCKNCSCKSFRAVLSIYISKKYLLKCVRSVCFVSFLANLKNALMIAQSQSFKEYLWFDLKKSFIMLSLPHRLHLPLRWMGYILPMSRNPCSSAQILMSRKSLLERQVRLDLFFFKKRKYCQ